MATSPSKPHALLILLLAGYLTLCHSNCKFVAEEIHVDDDNDRQGDVRARELPHRQREQQVPPDGAQRGSGRCTNGKNVGDLLIDRLGLPSYNPHFLDPSPKGRRVAGSRRQLCFRWLRHCRRYWFNLCETDDLTLFIYPPYRRGI